MLELLKLFKLKIRCYRINSIFENLEPLITLIHDIPWLFHIRHDYGKGVLQVLGFQDLWNHLSHLHFANQPHVYALHHFDFFEALIIVYVLVKQVAAVKISKITSVLVHFVIGHVFHKGFIDLLNKRSFTATFVS